MQIAVLVKAAQVAGVQHAVNQDLGGVSGKLVVALHHALVGLDEPLAVLGQSDLAAVADGHCKRVVAHADGDARTGLGQAIAKRDTNAAGLGLLEALGRAVASADQDGVKLRIDEVTAKQVLKQDGNHGGDRGVEVGPVIKDVAAAAAQCHGCAREERPQQATDEAKHVAQRWAGCRCR